MVGILALPTLSQDDDDGDHDDDNYNDDEDDEDDENAVADQVEEPHPLALPDSRPGPAQWHHQHRDQSEEIRTILTCGDWGQR